MGYSIFYTILHIHAIANMLLNEKGIYWSLFCFNYTHIFPDADDILFFVGYIPYTCVSKFERHKYSFPIYIWDQNTIFNKTWKQSYKIIYMFNVYSTKRHIKKLFTHM